MAYTEVDYRTKKELKQAVAEGRMVRVYSPGPFPAKKDGTEFLEGPHYPKPHTWYAQVEMVRGLVVKVK